MPSDDGIFLMLVRPALFLPLFALVLFRISGLMMTAPIYGSDAVPIRLRAGLAVVISFMLFPILSPHLPAHVSLATAFVGGMGELLIGLIMGLGMSLMFSGVQLAGMVIGQQAGLSLGQVYDPVSGGESTVLGQVFFLVAMTVFLVAGGHRELMRALLDSYQTIPVLGFRFENSMLSLVIGLLTSAYALALRMAGPVLMALLSASLVMGFLSRTMPQMNILSVGFMVRIFLALGATAFALSADGGAITDAIHGTIDTMRQAFELVAR